MFSWTGCRAWCRPPRRRGFHVSREYAVDPLEVPRVEDVLDPTVQSVHLQMKVRKLSDRIAARETEFTRHNALPIMESDGTLRRIITRGDVGPSRS